MSKITPPAGQRLLQLPMIQKALLSKAGPAKWNDEDAFCAADQADRIGSALILADVHKHLNNTRIGYLFRKKMTGRGDRIRLAHASLVGGKLQYFSELDFLVEINWEAWMHIEPHQRVALMDHELCHFGVDRTGEDVKHLILHHDVEEFGAIVKRWGFWEQGLATFGGVVREQLELLGATDTLGTLAD